MLYLQAANTKNGQSRSRTQRVCVGEYFDIKRVCVCVASNYYCTIYFITTVSHLNNS